MAAIGLLLVLVGLTLLVIEAHVTAFGIFGAAGVVATAGGFGLIIDGAGASLGTSIAVAVALLLIGGVTLVVAARKVIAARRQEVQAGPEHLAGQCGLVRSWDGEEGQIYADGALWGARTSFGWEDPAPQPGEAVIVNQLDGLTVSVRRLHTWEMEPVWKPSELSL
ncbi:NfeD family protein [Dermatophilaceae bacterium Sec6.4]